MVEQYLTTTVALDGIKGMGGLLNLLDARKLHYTGGVGLAITFGHIGRSLVGLGAVVEAKLEELVNAHPEYITNNAGASVTEDTGCPVANLSVCLEELAHLEGQHGSVLAVTAQELAQDALLSFWQWSRTDENQEVAAGLTLDNWQALARQVFLELIAQRCPQSLLGTPEAEEMLTVACN